MKCSRCGFQALGANYCAQCGQQLGASPTSTKPRTTVRATSRIPPLAQPLPDLDLGLSNVTLNAVTWRILAGVAWAALFFSLFSFLVLASDLRVDLMATTLLLGVPAWFGLRKLYAHPDYGTTNGMILTASLGAVVTSMLATTLIYQAALDVAALPHQSDVARAR